MKKLIVKVKTKARQFPDLYDLNGLDKINSFLEFDTKYSAPINGFKDAEDFYKYASAGNYIEGIQAPILFVNSINDPMFPEDCYPYEAARNHKYFYLETPEKGGHLGYWRSGQKISCAEQRALQFVSTVMGLS